MCQNDRLKIHIVRVKRVKNGRRKNEMVMVNGGTRSMRIVWLYFNPLSFDVANSDDLWWQLQKQAA